jgi:ribose-phosphate pyrophosphokinase
VIVGGAASQLLASRVARVLGEQLLLTEFKSFPDGEQYTRVLGKIPRDVVIVQSTATDSDFINLLQLIDACEGADITVVIPYMGYARQDRRFKEGEAVSSRALARTLDVEKVVTVNLHEESILRYFKTGAVNLDATPLLGEHLRGMRLADPVVIAPDGGAVSIARSAATVIGAEYDYLEKTRISGEEVEIKPKKLDIAGRDVILIDDMISTGGTMAEAISLFKAHASSIHVACVHPVLTGNALLRLYHAGVRDVISTDTLEKATSVVSVARLIASALRE